MLQLNARAIRINKSDTRGIRNIARLLMSAAVVGLALIPGASTPSVAADPKPGATNFRALTGGELSGVVVNPDGKPAVGAQIGIANWTVEVALNSGRLSCVGDALERGLKIVETDAAGRFRLPAEADPELLVVAHETGYAEVDDPRAASAKSVSDAGGRSPDSELRITLERWGRVVGYVRNGDRPVAGARFHLGSMSRKSFRRAPSRTSHIVESDASGKFIVLRLPPGRAWCQRYAPLPPAAEGADDDSRPAPGEEDALGGLLVHFEVTAGQVVRLSLESPGLTVVGRLAPPTRFKGEIAWSMIKLQISPRPPTNPGRRGGRGGPGMGGGFGPLPQASVWNVFMQSDEAKNYARDSVPVSDDGSFRIESLPPGDYIASVVVRRAALSAQARNLSDHWSLPIRISLPTRESTEAVDVGVLKLCFTAEPAGTNREDADAAQLKRSTTPDDRAQALAVRAHATLSAVDRLPRFFIRISEGNGDVESMSDSEACTLDGLKQAINGAILGENGHESAKTLAWSGTQALLTNLEDRVDLEDAPLLRHCSVWTREQAWSRSQTDEEPTTFNFIREPEEIAGSLSYNAFFRVTPHRFWWGQLRSRNSHASPVPPEQAAYRFVGQEEFDGERCDVVEAARRQERLWISQASGRLRGVLNYMYSGQLSQGPPFYTTELVQKIAGRSFANQTEYASWVLNMSPEQALQLALATSDSYSGGYRPNELICFRDYREVAPDVWMPFREDRAFTHPVARRPGRHKYIRLWAAVQNIRTDFDLSETIARLEPKNGDRVSQDQRFGLPVGYEYRADRTPREMLELVAAERQTPAMQNFLGSLTWPIENQVGRAAPKLPADGWIGSPPARLAGKPYLVHFWATWSDSCKDDFSALKDLAAEGATIIGIHPAGTPAAAVQKAAEEARLNFPTLLAVENAPRHFDQRIAGFPVWMFPYCVLVDSQGKVAAHGSLSPELIARFRALPSEKSEKQSK